VTFSDQRGTPLRAFPTAFVTPNALSENDFVTLAPGATTVLTFTARFVRQAIIDISGRVLDFGDSVIVIPATGTYDFRLEIEQPKEAIDELAAQFGVPNPWHGWLTSERRTIRFR